MSSNKKSEVNALNCDNYSKTAERNRSSIVFFGSPLIDFTINVEKSFLKKHNLDLDNAYRRNSQTDWIFTKINEYQPRQTLGGSVTNTARIFRRFSNLPKDGVTYWGTIGVDTLGDFVKKQLKDEGISIILHETNQLRTGTVVVLICGKSRTLITDLGASQFFPNELFLLDQQKCIAHSSHIYFSAFFLNVSYEVLQRVFSSSQFNRSLIIFNLAAPFLSEKFPREMTFFYENSNVIVGNEREHETFARVNGISGKNLNEILEKTRIKFNNNKQIIVATRNEKPILVFDKFSNELEEFPVPVFEQVFDTNGAGDVFIGGFLVKFVEKESLSVCVNYGIQTVTEILTKRIIKNKV